MNASVSTLTTKGAKHGTCWMSHTSAKGVGHEQRGRAQRKKTVLSGMNDTKCDLERKTRLVGRSRGIHVNKYKS